MTLPMILMIITGVPILQLSIRIRRVALTDTIDYPLFVAERQNFICFIKLQGHVKVITKLVIPAEAGIQKHRKILDSHFRGNDDNLT